MSSPFDDNNCDNSWHINKTISIGHLISTIVIAFTVFSWANTVDKRVEQNAQALRYITQRQELAHQNVTVIRKELRDDLKSISKKLDHIIESRKY